MGNYLHHVSIFVTDMERALHLFRDILDFELLWRVPNVGGQKLSALLGITDMEAELAYLQSSPYGVAIELSRLIRPEMDASPVRFGMIGSIGLSLVVEDLGGLHKHLTKEGWIPLTPCLHMRSPESENIRVFCVRVEDSLTLEFIEQNSVSIKNGETG